MNLVITTTKEAGIESKVPYVVFQAKDITSDILVSIAGSVQLSNSIGSTLQPWDADLAIRKSECVVVTRGSIVA